MKRNLYIQIKAALLLLIFALNTVVGFACVVGLDMGFNSAHHEELAVEVAAHVHADEKKHEHHDEAGRKHHDKKADSKTDDCCNGKVIKFQNLDKNLTQYGKISVAVGEYVAILNNPFGLNNLKVFNTISPKQIDRNFNPPPRDIRIAISSFQI